MTSTGTEFVDSASFEPPATGMVVGIDGSGPSLHALHWAVQRTERFGSVQPVIAWHYPWWSYLGTAVPASEPFESEARAEIEKALGSIRPHHVAEPIVVRGRAASALIEVGASAGLIVVGTRGRSGLRDDFLGSVSSAVVARSTVPVAVVPPSVSIGDRSRHVVVGVDGSSNSAKALEWAVNNVPATSVIEAVLAWMPPVAPLGSPRRRDEADYEARARARLDESMSSLPDRKPASPYVTARLAAGDPRVVLRELSLTSDLLVLGARGGGLIADLLIGSVTTALVNSPRTTTIVIPA